VTTLLTLGIDPGTAIMGYGLVESGPNDEARSHVKVPSVSGERLRMVEYGALYTPAHTPLVERLPMLYQGLRDLINEYKPSAVAIEQLFFNKNVRTALAVGQARGVAILAAAHAGLPVGEYTPLQVKQAVVGYGRATKEQVQAMVRILLNMDHIPRPDDAADALAIAICHIHSVGYERLQPVDDGRR
jgi:crossover junction endodeoxyribonuclease RuvC